MSDLQIGTISASILLRLDSLKAGVAEANTTLAGLSASMQEQMAGIAADSEAAAARMKASLAGLSTALIGIGGAITGGLAVAVRAGEDYDKTLLTVSANASMTREQTEQMRQTVESLGSTTAAPLERIAQGYFHVSNFGYQAADATKILEAATQAAVATGGDASKTAEVLAGTMHNFGISVDQAGSTMEVLRIAAARANATLEEFANAAGGAFAKAHAFGVSLPETSAAIETLTQHQFSASAAATLFENAIAHIAVPTERTKKQLEKMGLKELEADFSQAGLRSKGFVGVLEDLEKAAKKVGIPVTDLINQLLRGALGGTGTAVLAQNLAEYTKNVKELDDISKHAAAGTWQFAVANNSLSGRIQILQNNFTILAREIKEALLPALNPILDAVQSAIVWFKGLDAGIRDNIVRFTALVGVGLLAAGILLKLSAAFSALAPVLAVVGAALSELAIPIALVAGGVALLAAAWINDWGHIREKTKEVVDYIKPYVERAWKSVVSAFAEAGKALREFWGRIEPDLKEFLATLSQILASFGITWQSTWNDFAQTVQLAWDVIKGIVRIAWDIVAGIIETGLKLLNGDWRGAWDSMGHYLTDIWNSFRDTVSNGIADIRGMIQGMTNDLSAARQDLAQDLGPDSDLPGGGIDSDLPGGGTHARPKAAHPARTGGGGASPSTSRGHSGGGRGGKSGGADHAAEDLKRELQQRAEETARAVADTMESIFRLTHDEIANQRHEALRQFSDRRDSGVPFDQALRELVLENQKIDAAEREGRLKRQQEEAQGIQTSFTTWAEGLAKTVEETKAAMAKRNAALKAANTEVSRISEGVFAAMNAGWALFDRTQREADEETARVRYEMNHKDYADYQAILLKKIQGLRIYSEAWRKVYEQLQQMTKENVAENQADSQKTGDRWTNVLEKIKQESTNILSSAIGGLFEKGFKHFFDNILQGFEQMLEQMLAKAIASGIISLLTGGSFGGGFLGGLLGGFDDASNDATATRWGFDFANMFTRGIANFQQQRLSPVASGNGGHVTNVAIHIPQVHIDHPADVNRIAEQIAYRTAEKLRGTRFGSG